VSGNKKISIITFKNVQDYRDRIARLFQEQKEDETYCFNFLDKETEIAHEKLMKAFDAKIKEDKSGMEKTSSKDSQLS